MEINRDAPQQKENHEMTISRPPSNQPLPPHARCVFKGKLFDVYQWEQQLYDGRTATFEKLKRPDSVVVFGVLEDGSILLSEQEQPGKAPFAGALGGRVDEGEDPLDAAKRELREESGYEASEFTLIDAQHPASKIDWVVYTFIAKGLRQVAAPALDGGEKIALKPVTFDEFITVASNERFAEKEISHRVMAALCDTTKMAELKKLFAPT